MIKTKALNIVLKIAHLYSNLQESVRTFLHLLNMEFT